MDGVTFQSGWLGLPRGFSRSGAPAGAAGAVRGIVHGDPGREEVEFDATGGVTGVGAAVDLEDDGDGVRRTTKFVGDFGNEPAFTFVAERNPDIGDELARKREK